MDNVCKCKLMTFWSFIFSQNFLSLEKIGIHNDSGYMTNSLLIGIAFEKCGLGNFDDEVWSFRQCDRKTRLARRQWAIWTKFSHFFWLIRPEDRQGIISLSSSFHNFSCTVHWEPYPGYVRIPERNILIYILSTIYWALISKNVVWFGHRLFM